MDLKRIEIEGFKSFAERTVVPVEKGLTGIVGPNGCGKSNVIDAMLWVLGERSPRVLRADSMEDVIFKGADGRPPGPYAMVEIILCDDEGKVGERGAEVAVGRRLFRSGESEFLLNGRKVRRKDVREVLLDTGLGVRGYMVLAQGKIDAILAANPRDRRQVFEEAAGISRYRERKEETLRKLDGVGQNLARVEDVLAEVQKNVRSLRYQAGKARRFLETRDRYRSVRVRGARAEETRLHSEAVGLQERSAALEETIAAIRQERGEVETRLEALEREAEALRSRHEELRREAAGLKERAAGLEERIHGLQARAAEMEGRLGRERERQAELNREKEDLAAQAGTLAGEKAEAEVLLARSKREVADCEAAFEERSRARGELRRRMEELRGQVLEALGERTRWNNQREEAAHRRSECEGSLNALARRCSEVEDGLARLSAEQGTQEATLEQAETQVASAEGRAAGLVRKRESFRQAAERHAGRARAAGERAAQAQARLAALGSIEEERQDLPEHVRELLASPPEGIQGLFLDGIRILPPWDRLLENLLGRMQHALWADGRGRGKLLRAGTFDLFFPPAAGLSPVNVTGARPLRELLQGDPDRCEALCSRLGEVYCV
ncbi:MAG: chromosome segregation SMC family protein, partial [Planctomycetota bacterium]